VKAYSYSGSKWGSYPVSIDVSGWPAGWVSPLASSMSAWNNASSPFYFNSGSSGHRFYTVASIPGNPLAKTDCSPVGTITDCDTRFNLSQPWATNGSATAYDVQNAAAHELGHWLFLNDVSGGGDTEATMYFGASLGEIKKRTLHSDDINGINFVYP